MPGSGARFSPLLLRGTKPAFVSRSLTWRTSVTPSIAFHRDCRATHAGDRRVAWPWSAIVLGGGVGAKAFARCEIETRSISPPDRDNKVNAKTSLRGNSPWFIVPWIASLTIGRTTSVVCRTRQKERRAAARERGSSGRDTRRFLKPSRFVRKEPKKRRKKEKDRKRRALSERDESPVFPGKRRDRCQRAPDSDSMPRVARAAYCRAWERALGPWTFARS